MSQILNTVTFCITVEHSSFALITDLLKSLQRRKKSFPSFSHHYGELLNTV